MPSTSTHANRRDYDLTRHLVGSPRPVRAKPRHLVLVNAGPFASTLRCADLAARAVYALTGANPPFAILDPRMALAYRDVRGVPWSDFPVLSDPSYRYAPLSIFNRYEFSFGSPPRDSVPVLFPDREGRLDWRVQPLSSVLEVVEGVLVVPGPQPEDAWMLAARGLLADVIDERPRVDLWTSEGITRLDRSGSAGLGAEALPLARFDFCYRLNFRAIAGKAIAHALAERPEGDAARRFGLDGRKCPILGERGDWSNPSVEDLARRLEHPVALQALYAVRRAGRIALPEHTLGNGGSVNIHVPHLLASVMPPDPESRGAHADSRWLWPGSGKHPPASVAKQEIERFTGGAYFAGFLEADESGLSLSRVGEIFLDTLHPDCEDPDVPCRWNGMPAAKAGPSVDRWMMRFFRKMKTRVNKLP